MNARQPSSPPATHRAPRWLAGAGVAAAVIAVVVAVQAAAGGSDDGVGAAASAAPSEAPDGLAVQLFDAQTPAPEVTRTTSDDLGAAWPVGDCTAPGATDAGRTDFLIGTEIGLEYSRDLAIGWYDDADAAGFAYDAVLARIAACAAAAGSRLTTEPAALGNVGSTTVVLSAGVEDVGEAAPGGDGAAGEVEASLLTVARAGSVIVLAGDHAGFYGAPPAESVARTAAEAERLLAAACGVAPDRC